MRCFACSENVIGPGLCWSEGLGGASPFYPISTQVWGLTMAYAERRERQKGVRYRGIYKAADGRYRSAGTFNTEERALAVALEAERHAAEVAGGTAGGLGPGTRARGTAQGDAPPLL